MAKLLIQKGKTSKLLRVFVQDSSATTGAGLTGLAYNAAGLTAYYIREGDSSATAITLATMTVGTWASGGFKEISSANMPGIYEIGIPDAALASGANSVIVMLKGATNMAPVVLEIQLVSFDPNDAVRLGLTALPNANAGANGGLPLGNASGYVTVATNNDKTGYALTQAFPSNFSSLAITGGGAVTAGTVSDKTGYTVSTVSDKTGYSLSVTPPTGAAIAALILSNPSNLLVTDGSGRVTAASVAGAVGSVTGNVGGNVVGSVASVTAGVTVSTNNDKTGYTASSVTDKTGYSLSSGGIQAIWDALMSNLTTSGSVGKLLADNLNAAVGAVKTVTDKLSDMITGSSPTYAFDVDALANAPSGGGGGTSDWTSGEKQQIRDALGVDGTKTTATGGQLQTFSSFVDTELGTIAGYIDTEVGAIKTQTDKLSDMITGSSPNYSFDATALQNAPAGEGGGGLIQLNLDQVIDGDVTLLDVFKAAWCQGAGTWRIDEGENTLNLYGPDNETVYFTFALDDPQSPTERVRQ